MPTENKPDALQFDLNAPDGGRGYIAHLFKTVLKRHDYRQYIAERLAGDFACTMAQHLERITAERDALQLLMNERDGQADAAQAEMAALREELATAKPVRPPHFCGLPMSLNPHPEAGVPGRFLEVGAVSECIPCLVASRHGWARMASDLQQRLTAAEQRNAKLVELTKDALKTFNYHPEGSCNNPGIAFVKPWSIRAAELIKPTEPGVVDDDIPDFSPGNGNKARRRAETIHGFKIVEDPTMAPNEIRLACTCKPSAYDGFNNGSD